MKVRGLIIIILIILVIIGIVLIGININKKEQNTEINTNENEVIEDEENVVEEFVEVLDGGVKLNKSEELSKTKTFEGLTIKNIQLTNGDGKTELIADIENTTSSNKEAMLINVVFYDKDNNEIATIGGRISPIKAGQTMQFSTSAMIDYANAYDFEFKLK